LPAQANKPIKQQEQRKMLLKSKDKRPTTVLPIIQLIITANLITLAIFQK
jgi:hypothetical protein